MSLKGTTDPMKLLTDTLDKTPETCVLVKYSPRVRKQLLIKYFQQDEHCEPQVAENSQHMTSSLSYGICAKTQER